MTDLVRTSRRMFAAPVVQPTRASAVCSGLGLRVVCYVLRGQRSGSRMRAKRSGDSRSHAHKYWQPKCEMRNARCEMRNARAKHAKYFGKPAKSCGKHVKSFGADRTSKRESRARERMSSRGSTEMRLRPGRSEEVRIGQDRRGYVGIEQVSTDGGIGQVETKWGIGNCAEENRIRRRGIALLRTGQSGANA
eukprot:3528786-Rhodomonas_salina.1